MASDTDPSGLLAMSIIFIPLLVLAVSLRFYSRAFFHLPRKADDWLMLPALALTIGMCIIGIIGTRKHALGYPTPGIDDPMSSIRSESPEEALVGKLLWSLQFIDVFALCSIKLGALFFYRRIFCQHDCRSAFSIFTWVLIGTVMLWAVIVFVFIFLQCDGAHVSALWTTEANFIRYCTRTPSFDIGFASSDFVTDVLVIFLPIPRVWLIKASNARKIALTAVFALAFIGLAASASRLAQFIKLSKSYRLGIMSDPDLDQTINVFWSVLQASISLIAVNLASLWGLFSKISPKRILHSARSLLSRSFSQPRSSIEKRWPGHGNREKRGSSTSSESFISPQSVLVRTEVNVFTTPLDLEEQADRMHPGSPEPYLPPTMTRSKLTLGEM